MLTVVGVMASTVLAIVERISATVRRVASWFSEGCEEYIVSRVKNRTNDNLSYKTRLSFTNFKR